MCKRSHLLQVVAIWLNAFTGDNVGIFKVHSLGYCTVVFVSCDSAFEWTRTQITSSFETEDIFQEELFVNLGKVMAMKIVLEHHQTLHKLVIFLDFSEIFYPRTIAKKL